MPSPCCFAQSSQPTNHPILTPALTTEIRGESFGRRPGSVRSIENNLSMNHLDCKEFAAEAERPGGDGCRVARRGVTARRHGKVAAWNVCLGSADNFCGAPTRRAPARGTPAAWGWTPQGTGCGG